MAIGRPNFSEKQPIARHRKIDSGAGENQSVVATESRDHDRSRHAHRARISKNGGHRRHRDAILRSVLDFGKWQQSEISNVRQQIKNYHASAAEEQCAHQISRGIAHFASDERNIRPGGLRKERADH